MWFVITRRWNANCSAMESVLLLFFLWNFMIDVLLCVLFNCFSYCFFFCPALNRIWHFLGFKRKMPRWSGDITKWRTERKWMRGNFASFCCCFCFRCWNCERSFIQVAKHVRCRLMNKRAYARVRTSSDFNWSVETCFALKCVQRHSTMYVHIVGKLCTQTEYSYLHSA